VDEVVPTGAPAIRAERLSKHYGSVHALEDLNLEVGKGEVVGYLGPNGAGKTTTIRLLLGLIQPTRGRAEIFGLDCQRQVVEAHKRLAYVAGEANLWPSLTGAETLHLLGRIQGRVDVAYREELISRFDLDPSKKVRTYSKGNRQKLILVAALMTRPDLLVLDEPTSGLDPLMEQAFRRCIHEARDRGQAVFLSSHILSEVEALCDRIGILREGSLVEMGTLAEMRHLSALTVEVTFDGPVPDLTRVPGVTSLEVEGEVVRCHVQGSPQPLLQVLATSGVHELLSREPSLEELFLAQYGASPSSDGSGSSKASIDGASPGNGPDGPGAAANKGGSDGSVASAGEGGSVQTHAS
jgi:ABC-2 type transport system ATP-binding protein